MEEELVENRNYRTISLFKNVVGALKKELEARVYHV